MRINSLIVVATPYKSPASLGGRVREPLVPVNEPVISFLPLPTKKRKESLQHIVPRSDQTLSSSLLSHLAAPSGSEERRCRRHRARSPSSCTAGSLESSGPALLRQAS
ncbi:hypothetical protein ZWY2020_010591 [Hordeum vulgare]|nr:hypothetical protein ZWY2020_010591 [Hordeum vulgare]